MSRVVPAGFMGSRETVLDWIYAMGSSRCAYGAWPAGGCDCKYGWRPQTPHSSEQTGCPELRSLHAAISAMTDDEWALLTRRAGGVFSGMFVASPVDIRRVLQLGTTGIDQAIETLGQVRAALDEGLEAREGET